MNINYVKDVLTKELSILMGRINDCYLDKRGREHALKYITGLLSPIERKNGWQLAEARGDTTPYAIQQFLYRGNWSADELRDSEREYVKEHLGTEDAVLIVDETGFLKKGKKSAGVMRQYSGTAGRIENCQVGVFLTYSSSKGFTIIDRELYLPKEWTYDPVRCTLAGIPETVQFKSKPQMALNMLKYASENGMPFSWVTADSLYGNFRGISIWLESIEKGYVLAVSGKAYVWQGMWQHRVSTFLESLPEEGWYRTSAGTGSKGERYYDWLCYGLNKPPVKGWNRYLLIRRNISDPSELRAFICFCPDSTSINKLAEVAGSRWVIEQSFEESKGEVGLDHYEVRSYEGWYKHITLACCAHALLAVMRNNTERDKEFQTAIEIQQNGSLTAFKKGRNL